MGRPRHDHLQLPERSERPVRRYAQRSQHAADLRAPDRSSRIVPDADVPLQAVHHGLGHGQRNGGARARAQRHLREPPPFARLHAERPAQGADGSDRVLPGLSHLRQRARRERHRPSCDRRGDLARPPPQPGDGKQHLRLHPRACCCRPRRSTIRRRRRRRPPAPARVRDEVPAVHRSGARERRRGHVVLPLQRAGLAERGRRRSRTLRPHASAISTTRTGAAWNAGRSR